MDLLDFIFNRFRLLVSGVAFADQRGQTMAEYGILIAVIAVIVVVAATLLGSNVSSVFKSVGDKL